jgi:hypothetical protein
MDEFEKKVKRGKVSYAAAEDILIKSRRIFLDPAYHKYFQQTIL